MKAQLISIGNELLMGDTVNTNASWLGQFLYERGIQVQKIQTVTDDKQAITQALVDAMDSAELIISTGGLGPTLDDITKKCLAEYFKVGLVHVPEVEAHIKAIFKRRNLEYSNSNQAQTYIPENATLLFNAAGTAPGMLFQEKNTWLIVLPGVPHEMKHIMSEVVAPKLHNLGALDVLETRYLKIAGVGESHLADFWLSDLSNYLTDGLDIAFLPSTGQVSLRLTARAHEKEEAVQAVESYASLIKERLGGLIYSEDKEESLAAALGRVLQTEKYSIATAESCTGGLMGHLLTETPGSSAYYEGGVISYDNQVKIDHLGVLPADLASHGAVSAPVALAMAKGVAERLGTDIGISATGIAGPDGGSLEKPVGMVWLGFFTPSEHFAVRADFSHNRSLNKVRSAITAFEIARRTLLGMDSVPYELKKITPDMLADEKPEF